MTLFPFIQESRDPRKLHWLFEMLMESPVNGEGGSFVDAWWVERLLPQADVAVTDKLWWLCFIFPLQSSLCAAGRPSSAGVACSRAPPQVATIPGAQTHTGLQECEGTNWEVRSFFYPHSEHECTISHYKLLCIFFCVSCSDLLSFQRAHIHLHDWCQPAIHSADHLPAHLWLHRPNTAAAEASNRGWWGDPESRDWGERGGSAGREDASHQATQNRWVKGLSSKHKRHNELLFFVGMV